MNQSSNIILGIATEEHARNFLSAFLIALSDLQFKFTDPIMNILTDEDGGIKYGVNYEMLRDNLDCTILTIRDCFPGVYTRDYDDATASRILVYTFVLGMLYHEEDFSDFCIIMESKKLKYIAFRREFYNTFHFRFAGEYFFSPGYDGCTTPRNTRTGPPNCVYDNKNCIFCSFIYNLGMKTKVYVRINKYHFKHDKICSFSPINEDEKF